MASLDFAEGNLDRGIAGLEVAEQSLIKLGTTNEQLLAAIEEAKQMLIKLGTTNDQLLAIDGVKPISDISSKSMEEIQTALLHFLV